MELVRRRYLFTESNFTRAAEIIQLHLLHGIDWGSIFERERVATADKMIVSCLWGDLICLPILSVGFFLSRVWRTTKLINWPDCCPIVLLFLFRLFNGCRLFLLFKVGLQTAFNLWRPKFLKVWARTDFFIWHRRKFACTFSSSLCFLFFIHRLFFKLRRFETKLLCSDELTHFFF